MWTNQTGTFSFLSPKIVGRGDDRIAFTSQFTFFNEHVQQSVGVDDLASTILETHLNTLGLENC